MVNYNLMPDLNILVKIGNVVNQINRITIIFFQCSW